MARRLALVIGLLLSAATLEGCCTARIRGVVRDQATGAPITGATVQSGEVQATTDNFGFYDLRDLECDDVWRVVVQAPGFHVLSTSVLMAEGEDAGRVMRDFPLVAVVRQEPPSQSDAPPIQDYTPRHASLAPSEADHDPDRRMFIKLTEQQTRTLLRHLESHGSEGFTTGLRKLIESLPQK